MGWNPNMDEAPRDGTEILGFRKDCGVVMIRWGSAHEFLTEEEIEKVGNDSWEFEEDWFCADFICGTRLSHDMAPTHWMPLPQPPKEQ